MMADDNKKTPGTEPDGNALESFLSRDNAPEMPGKKAKKSKGLIIIICAALAVIILVVLLIVLNNQPYPESTEDIYVEAGMRATVDEAGMHIAEVFTDDEGEPVQNGEGRLLDYTPSEISEVRVERGDGFFTVVAHNHPGQATEYTLKDLEDFILQTGMPDSVANDAAQLNFIKVASAGGKPADFGIDEPRAVVSVTYTDGTFAVIYVGDEAPASAGTYISFGNSDTVYLVSDDAVDSFFYNVNDFISLVITESADTVEDNEFKRLTISGSNFPETIVIEPNADDAVNYQYKVTSPSEFFASPYAAADIAGTIRDLYAEEVVAVRSPELSLNNFLAPYGLQTGSYAEIVAEYPDTTVRLRASAPDSEGYVYLVNDSSKHLADRIVFKIQLGAVSWAGTTLNALMPDAVLRVNREALSSVTFKTGGRSYEVKLDTKTRSVDTDDGETEEVTTTEAYYKDKRLSDDSMSILLQNLNDLPRKNDDAAGSGSPLLELVYSYSTGRADDTIIIYDNGTKSLPVSLNGAAFGTTTKSYAEALIQNIMDVDSGKTPESI